MDREEKNKKSDKQSIYREVAPHLNLGLQLALTIGACIVLGWWLDKKFNLTPILTLFFIFFGFFAGFFNFFRNINNKNGNE